MDQIKKPQLLPYLGRFTLLHLATYIAIGFVFLLFQFVLPESGRIALDFYEPFRPLGFMTVAGQILRGLAFALVFLGQIFRGIMLALLLAPFYGSYIFKKRGWLLLFLLMFGLTALGSPLFLTEFILFEGTFMEFLKDLVIGIPEIVSQMLVFSLIFFWWQRKAERII